MPANAIRAQGTSVRRGNGATPEVFTHIGHIKGFDGPGGSASIIDSSTLDSTARNKLMGLKDEGSFSFRMNLLPGEVGQEGLRDDRDAAVLRNFQVVLTDEDATTLGFAGYVTEFRITGEVDGLVEAAVTIEIDGPVDWDAGA